MGEFEDEQMVCLRASLLAHGKGRRPAIPQLEMNNRVLYQLHLLRVEGKKSRVDVAMWLKKIWPSLSFPGERFSRYLDRVAEKIASLEGQDLHHFLNQPVNLDFISPSLENIGVTRALDKNKFHCIELTNEVVIDLFLYLQKEGHSYKFILSTLNDISITTVVATPDQLRKNLRSLEKSYRKLLKSKEKDAVALDAFLKQPYNAPKSSGRDERHIPTAVPAPTQDDAPSSSAAASLQPIAFNSAPQLQAGDEQHLPPTVPAPVNDVLSAAPCSQPDTGTHPSSAIPNYQLWAEQEFQKNLNLRTELKTANQRSKVLECENLALSSKLEELTSCIKANEKAQVYKNNHKLRKDLEHCRTKLSHFRKQVSKLTCVNGQLEAHEKALESQLARANGKVTKRTAKILQLEGDIVKLTGELEVEQQKRELQEKAKGTYSNDMRRAVMRLQGELGIPAVKCSDCISIVAAEIFHHTFKQLPKKSTIINIADEGHAISKAHLSEVMAANKFTLHTDGTSRDGIKIVGRQLTLECGSQLSLGFGTVACEDADTLLAGTISLFEEISDVHCDIMNCEEREESINSILVNLQNAMSDRAATMKSFNDKLDAHLKTVIGEGNSVNFLYCNAHFLLGLSRSAEETLRLKESEIKQISGQKLGREALDYFKNWGGVENASSRVVRAAADILAPRGDEKNGCRAEWIAFCVDNGIKSKLVSYRTNRFNNYFENAAAVIIHREHICKFLSNLHRANMKIRSVLADLQDDTVVALVSALAVCHIFVTGPYWKLVQSSVPYADFHIYVRLLHDALQAWQNDPSCLFKPSYGIFPEEFELQSSDSKVILNVIRNKSTQQLTLSCIASLAQGMLTVLERQLNDFLRKGKFGPEMDPALKAILMTCPVTNLLGEREFGCLDYCMHKRRHTTMHHRTTLQMISKNKPMSWVDTKCKTEEEQIFANARKIGKFLRKQHQQQEKLVLLKIKEKQMEFERQQHEKEIYVLNKKKEASDSVMQHGGPALSLKDVCKIPDSTEALRAQIRYHKLVLGAKGLKFGTKLEMLGMLKNLFRPSAGSSSSPCRSPPLKRRRLDESSSSGEDEENEMENEEVSPMPSFSFSENCKDQWVCVFYDNMPTFYAGQVTEFISNNTAVVKFMAKTKGRKDFFRWPAVEDIDETVHCEQVFFWDFEVSPVSSDLRVWSIPDIDAIDKAFKRIKSSLGS